MSDKPIALEERDIEPDGRRYSPSVQRNRDVIRDVFLAHATSEGRILEIASGTGEHGAHITASAAELEWVYSDPDHESRVSQTAWALSAGHDRLLGPLNIDTRWEDWGTADQEPFDAIVSVNMIHIAPFAACEGLFRGAVARLRPGGAVFLYGPFARNGRIAPSNASFSASLQARDPSWGVRDLERDIVPVADSCGFALERIVEMPANNLSVVFRKVDAQDG